jgi:general secretion pathway protein G
MKILTSPRFSFEADSSQSAGRPSLTPALSHPMDEGNTFSRRARRQRGFTLIELLLVLVILGILAALVVPKFSGRTEQAREAAARSQLAIFGTALDAFEVDNGFYPKGRNGLQDLVVQPRDAQNWKGPYLKGEIPNDPWNNAYVYECPGKHNPNHYDLMSAGPDGREGGDDDITNWQQGNSRPQR